MPRAMQPLVSIITVVKNDDEGLLTTARSLINQGELDFEWIIVDSSDNHDRSEVLKRLRTLDWIHVFYQAPSGIYAAMNYATEKSRGTWVWFINAGDFMLTQTAISESLKIMRSNPEVDMLGTTVLQVTKTGFLYGFSQPHLQEIGGRIIAHFHHQGSIIKKSSLFNVGKFDTALSYAADSKLIDAIAAKENVKIFRVAFVGFELGGLSGLNFKETLNEIKTHRCISTRFMEDCKVKVKNFLRMQILEREHWRLTWMYLRSRESKISREVQGNHHLNILINSQDRRYGRLFKTHVNGDLEKK